MTLSQQQKWTCDCHGNWRLVWRAVLVANNKLVEVADAATATRGRV